MLWGIGKSYSRISRVSPLESLLNKNDVTLEDVLEEDDVVQEVKQENPKLIRYLDQDSVIERLLAYVVASRLFATKLPLRNTTDGCDIDSTTSLSSRGCQTVERTSQLDAQFEPSSGSDESHTEPGYQDPELENRRMKFAYTACEILASHAPLLQTAIARNPNCIHRFWTFIKTSGNLDPVQSSYFAKINEILFHIETAAMIRIFKSLDNVVADMLQHVDSPVIMDLLLKIISLDREEGGQGTVDWLQSQDMIPILLSYLSPGRDESKQTAAGDYLKAIITISANATPQDQSAIGPNELTRQLVSEPCIRQLIDDMLSGGNSLTVGVGIIVEVIRKNNSDYDTADRIGPVPRSTDPIYLGTLLRCFAEKIPHFMKILHTPGGGSGNQDKYGARTRLRSAYGEEFEPLGFARFKTCELMAELLHCSNMKLLNSKGAAAEVHRRDLERERLKVANRTEPSSAFDPTLEAGTQLLPESTACPSGCSLKDVADEIAHTCFPDTTHGNTTQGKNTQLESFPDNNSPTSSKLSEIVQNLELGPSLSSSYKTVPSLETDFEDPTAKPPPLFSKRASTILDKEGDVSDSPNDPASPQLPTGKSRAGNETVDAQSLDECYRGGSEPQSHSPPLQDARPAYEVDIDGKPIVGDLLKMMFVEHKVVTTIIQIFTGTMEFGFNNSLVVDVFGAGRLIERIIEGQQASDIVQAKSNVRLGYMGHLTLISAEVIKFSETYSPPHSLPPPVAEKILSAEWIHYTETSLMETRERDNAILGGIRPEAVTYQPPNLGPGTDGLDDLSMGKEFPEILNLGGLSFSVPDNFVPSDSKLSKSVYLTRGSSGDVDEIPESMEGDGYYEAPTGHSTSTRPWPAHASLDLNESDQVGELAFDVDTL